MHHGEQLMRNHAPDMSYSKKKRLWIAASATALVAFAGLIASLMPAAPSSSDTHNIALPDSAKPWWKRAYKETVDDVDSMHCMGGPWNQCN